MVPLFPLGQVVAMPGALAALERANQTPTCSWRVMQAGTGANWTRPMWQRMSTAWLMGFGC